METGTKIIHVRFSPDGTVVEIGDRPAEVTPQDWFNNLADNAGDNYQALSGGRGVFRLTADEIEALKGKAAAE